MNKTSKASAQAGRHNSVALTTTDRASVPKWGPAWLHSPPSEPKQQLDDGQASQSGTETETRQIECDVADSVDPTDPTTDCDEDENEFCWASITDADSQYLLAPRQAPEPCPWCGGRLTHHWVCRELQASWLKTMPFGEHKGKPIADVPRSYLQWVLDQSAGSPELRDQIRALLPLIPNVANPSPAIADQ